MVRTSIGCVKFHGFDLLTTLLINFVVLGTVPIIRCPKGNAAEMVAEVNYLMISGFDIKFSSLIIIHEEKTTLSTRLFHFGS